VLGARKNVWWSPKVLLVAFILVVARMFGGRKNSYWLQPPAACNASTGHEGFKFLHMYTQTANRHLGRICVLRQR
jgi:hypothetical protein